MAKRKTHEEFVKELSVINPNIEVLGDYINGKTNIDCECKICNHKWGARPSHLLEGTGCPNCYKIRKNRTHDRFVSEIKEINSNLLVLGKYKTANDKVLTKCLICNHEWNPKAMQLLDGHGCPKCARMSKRKTHEQFVEEIGRINPDIKIKSKYTTYEDEVDCECKYGHIWSTKAKNLLEGHGCPTCRNINFRKNSSISQDEFEKRIYNVNPNIKIDGKYVNSHTRVKCHCVICNNQFTIKPTGKRLFCPVCSDGISYPNKFLRSFLEKLDINNLHFEYSPKWAKPYRYDSYFVYDNKKYIIEMDGGFHYNQSFGEQTPEKVRERDEIKEKLAYGQNINVIRIDCQVSDKDYIRDNILNSELANMFDLSIIDWNECHENSLKSMVKQSCDLYKEGYSTYKISKILNCSQSSIVNYLNLGAELSWCVYPKPRKKISVYKDNFLIDTFSNINDCIDYMNNNYDDTFYIHPIYSNCSGARKRYKGFVFKYAS